MRLRFVSALALLPLLTASAVDVSRTFAAAPAPEPAFAPRALTGTIDGPDVSSYQHPNGAAISWPAVRKSGHEFAIVKATEGTSYVNPWFARDYGGIRAAAMVRGSYHFAHPARPIASTALTQAKFYVARLGAVTATGTLPPALDLESTGGLSRAELVVWAQDFLLDVRQLTGRTPMIYSYPYFWIHQLGDPAALARYPLWMAAYSGGVDPAATLWQYSQSATVSGIRGSVDMSRVLASTDWSALSDGTVPSPWPASAPGQAQRVVPGAGVRSAVVTWLPPDAGSSALTGYDVGVAETGQVLHLAPTATRAAFGGLVTGRTYTLTVTPRNAVGTGPTTSRTGGPVAPTSLSISTTAASVDIGSSVTYVGTLRNGDTATPLVGMPVQIFSRPLGATAWGLLQTATTDDAGQVRIDRSPTRSTQLRMSYAGQVGVQQAAEAVATTLVRTSITAGLTHSVAAAGVPVMLRGAISPRFAGVVVARQVLSRGVWRTVATTRTGGAGSYAFKVGGNPHSTTYMRTVVAADRGRAPGYSNVVSLAVR
ncbi:MAG: fibronectin type III domain-containing protein [Frankiaceae bacterium]|nr:fibronectin type III domain-containing protein [Frankiaceae bacterium]